MKSANLIKLISALIFLGCLPNLHANEKLELSDDLLFEDLIQELEQVTAIATHTKLNIDYVPGMVTVLHGDDLLKQGLHTISEALQTIPGVEISLSNEGQNNYVMRGIGKSFSSGKIKMLVNGRAVNAALSAASTAATIPVELVERIEVIRGPGSAIYGEYAYAGVVNIILRKDRFAFINGSDHIKYSIGASLSNFESENPFKYTLNFSFYEYEGEQVKIGQDYLKTASVGVPALDQLINDSSKSPGTTNEIDRIYNSSLQVSYKDFQWDSYMTYQQVGDYFGYSNALPPKVEPLRTIFSASSDLDKNFSLNEKLTGLVSAGGRIYALRSKLHSFLPSGFPDIPTFMDSDPNNNNLFEDGVLGSPNYTEYEVHGSLRFNYTGIKKHDVMFGGSAAYIRQGNTWAKRNQQIVAGGGLTEVELKEYRGDDNWLTEGNSRKIISLFAQDQWSIFKPLTLTLGGRIDNYSEIGTSVNPRIAAVYNAEDQHIFKVQLSRAFRPPTFIEMFARNNVIAEGNADIKPETIESLEIGYIYNKSNTVFRSTAFYSEMNDLITNDDASGKYENLESVVSQGIELEFSRKLNKQISINANTTYLYKICDRSKNTILPNVARYYGYANISYIPIEKTKLVISDQFIGSRKREAGDPRSRLGAFNVVNVVLSTEDLLYDNMMFSLGIKNIFDRPVHHPAPLASLGNSSLPSYVDDYPRPGRELWANIIYKF